MCLVTSKTPVACFNRSEAKRETKTNLGFRAFSRAFTSYVVIFLWLFFLALSSDWLVTLFRLF